MATSKAVQTCPDDCALDARQAIGSHGPRDIVPAAPRDEDGLRTRDDAKHARADANAFLFLYSD